VWEETADRADRSRKDELRQPNHAPFRGRPPGGQGVVSEELAEDAVVAMRWMIVLSGVIVDVEADPL
jgi:hypothetical protein